MPALQDLRIVFMGTPEFAVASLHALLEAGCQVVAVITAPDKLAGRGLALQQSAVKKFALERGLTVLQPEKLKNPAFLESLQALKADLQIVVAFRMLPELVWNMPPMGTVNLHGSLLPDYRGAAPINWAIIRGETVTGATTFKLRQEIDTGDILGTVSLPIGPDETAGELHDRMMIAGAELLVQTVQGLASGDLYPKPQPAVPSEKTAPKIFTETCLVNWVQNTRDVYNHIRGLSPYPAAFTFLHDKKLKIFNARPEKGVPAEPAGTPVSDGKTFLKFATLEGYVRIDELQLEGKKRLATGDFLRGYRWPA